MLCIFNYVCLKDQSAENIRQRGILSEKQTNMCTQHKINKLHNISCKQNETLNGVTNTRKRRQQLVNQFIYDENRHIG